MIALNRNTKVFVSKDPADIMASYDTLFAKTKAQFEKDPFSNHSVRGTTRNSLFRVGLKVVWWLGRVQA